MFQQLAGSEDVYWEQACQKPQISIGVPKYKTVYIKFGCGGHAVDGGLGDCTIPQAHTNYADKSQCASAQRSALAQHNNRVALTQVCLTHNCFIQAHANTSSAATRSTEQLKHTKCCLDSNRVT